MLPTGRSGHFSIWICIWATLVITVTVTVDIIITLSSKCRQGGNPSLTLLPLLQGGVVTSEETCPPKAMAAACAGAGARGRGVTQKQGEPGRDHSLSGRPVQLEGREAVKAGKREMKWG